MFDISKLQLQYMTYRTSGAQNLVAGTGALVLVPSNTP